MPRTQQQYEEIRIEKKNLIIKSALFLFADQGYASTSISKIAKKAGISKGLMYNYFSSKEELLKEIINSFFSEILNVIDPNHDNIIDDKEASRFFDKIFDFYLTRHYELKMCYQLAFQPEVMVLMNELNFSIESDQYSAMFTEYFLGKGIQNPEFLTLTLSNVMKGFAMQYAFAPDYFSEDSLLNYKDYLKKIFLHKII